jgi:hypothetical protein
LLRLSASECVCRDSVWAATKVNCPPTYITEDPKFESRQGVRFLGVYTLECCCHNSIRIVIVFT